MKKSDKLWLYSDKRVLKAFKEMFEEFKKGDNAVFNVKLELFIEECRKDVLKSLGEKGESEKYKFITYNLPLNMLNSK